MSEIIHSDITGKDYDIKDAIRLINLRQCALYIKNGCPLLDIYSSIDYDTGDPIIVFLFDRKESKKYFDLWCKHELK